MKLIRIPFSVSVLILSLVVLSGPIPLDAHAANVRVTHRHRPISVRRVHDDQTAVDSTNWSGYAVTGPNNSVTYAAGSWIIPAATCSKGSAEYASFWVGIDGWSSPTVEQIGTDSDCSKGKPSYYAWYEFYPESSYNIASLANLQPGDVISASVTYNASSSIFTAAITDVRKQISFSTTFKPTPRTGTPLRSSAEWITEAPASGGGRILPLADFGLVDWGEDMSYANVSGTCFATVGGTTLPIGSFGSNGTGVWSSTMVNDKTDAPMAVPSALTPDGSSFFITWESVGP